MQRKLLLVVLVVTMLAACQSARRDTSYDVGTMALPQGHPSTGRAVFLEMGCTSCHDVSWEVDLPQPTAAVRGPVLDERLSRLTAGYLATSIAAPSYHVSEPYREYVPSGLSPMADYSNAITLRELVDLVAYLRMQGGEIPPSARVPIDRAMLPHHL